MPIFKDHKPFIVLFFISVVNYFSYILILYLQPFDKTKRKQIMKTLTLLFLFLSSFWVVAQDTTFTKRYYTDESDNGDIISNRLTPNFNNGVVICGNHNNISGLMVSTDSIGNMIWNKSISNSSFNTNIMDAITTSDSSLLVSGYNYSNSTINNVFCAKLNFDGDTLWTRTFNLTIALDENNNYVGVEELSDSSYILVSSSATDSLSKVVKLSSNGTIEWEKQLEGEPFKINGVCSNDTAATFLLAGIIDGQDGGVVKMDNDGEILWSKKYLNNRIYDIIQIGDYIYTLYNDNVWLMKLNLNGDVLWLKEAMGYYSPFDPYTTNIPTLTKINDSLFAVTANDYYLNHVSIVDTSGAVINLLEVFMPTSHLTKNKNGRVFISGNGPVYGIKTTLYRYHIGLITTNIQLDPSECSSGSSTFSGSTESNVVDTLQFTITNNSTQMNQNYLLDSLILTKDDKCVTYLGSLDKHEQVEVKVYPNITIGKTHFDFSENGRYEIVIFNLEGNKLQQVGVNGNSTIIDLSKYTSGIYLYKVIGNGATLNGKIVKR